MTAEVKTFPQGEVTRRRGEPTMIEVIEHARTPEEMMSLLAAVFPKATMGEVKRAIEERIYSLNEEVEKARREAGALERVEAVVVQDTARDDDTLLGESLDRLADAGNRDAAEFLAAIDSPAQREFWRLFDEAVEIDPYWEKKDDGRYVCKQGTLHDTPEKLVAAYGRNRRKAGFRQLW